MGETSEIVNPGRVRIGHWIGQGWDWFVEDLGMHILIALIALVFLYVGIQTVVGFLVLAGPIFAGLAVVGLRKAGQNPIDVKDFFDGFRYFVPSLLSTLLICLFALLGLILLIVPGLVILAMYQFSYHFIVERKQDFWDAMRSSRKVVSQDYFGFTLFGVLLGLINFLGLCFLVVGLLVSLPVTSLALTAAYLDFSGRLPEPVTSSSGPVTID